MPPVDNTPHVNTGTFELLYSLNAYERIPVYEYKSKETGLTVVIAETEGPVVNGFFCLGWVWCKLTFDPVNGVGFSHRGPRR